MFQIDTLEIVGFIAAILTTSAFIPQVYKTWKTKDVEPISLTMFIIMLIGISLWLIYGVYIQSLSMVIANTVTSILVLCIIIMKFRYKK